MTPTSASNINEWRTFIARDCASNKESKSTEKVETLEFYVKNTAQINGVRDSLNLQIFNSINSSFYSWFFIFKPE